MKWYRNLDLGILILRVVFGFRLIIGSQDNVFSYEEMLNFRDFLEVKGFPLPLVAAFVSVYFQFFAGISYVLGLYTRWFAGVMIINFLIAIFGAHIGDPYLATAPAVHMLTMAIFLVIAGPGKYSLDSRLKGKE